MSFFYILCICNRAFQQAFGTITETPASNLTWNQTIAKVAIEGIGNTIGQGGTDTKMTIMFS